MQTIQESTLYTQEETYAMTAAVEHRYFYRKRRVFVTFVLGGVRFS